MGSGGKTQSSSVSAPEYLQGALWNIAQDAKQQTQTGAGEYAPVNQETQGLLSNTLSAGQPVFNAGANALTNIASGGNLNNIAERISPQLSILQGQIRQGLDSQFGNANRYGSGLHQAAIAQAGNDAATNLYSNMYNQERGFQQQALGMVPQYYGQALDAGLMQQSIDQQQIDAPLRPIQQYANLIFPQAGFGSVQSTPLYQNKTAGALGGLAAGASIYNAFNQPNAGQAGGMLGGAASGAAAGSAFGPWGTAIGGIAGALGSR